LTVEQLEAARAERMRQNGHGAITLEDVRTWIEETGLCIFLPRSAQAGFTAPTFVEAVAGQRTTEPTLELIATAESLLVRLEADGVAVRLNLSGLPGDQPDYVVAGWVLPYIYALRGDRDWRRAPQLTGSRQVSQLAVLAAKQIDSANQTVTQIRDALGREVTEAATLRALHELWKQLRIIPVVPEVGQPALWQPLRQRFQKAIAEGASTSQVTAISVLASIYLQAVIAASMEDVELFLSPLTSRSKIREVVRGLAATRQVHSTTMGHSPMFYVAGTLPEFPAVVNFQIGSAFSGYPGQVQDDDFIHSVDDIAEVVIESAFRDTAPATEHIAADHISLERISTERIFETEPTVPVQRKPLVSPAARQTARAAAGSTPPSAKSAPPRPRPASKGGSVRSSGASGDRRRAPAPRGISSNGSSIRSSASPRSSENGRSNGDARRSFPSKNGASSNGHSANGHSNNGHAKSSSYGNGSNNGSRFAKPASGSGNATRRDTSSGSNGNGQKADTGSHSTSRPASRTASGFKSGSGPRSASPSRPTATNGASARPRGEAERTAHKPATRSTSTAKPGAKVTGAKTSAAKRYSFSGQAKQAPKPAAKPASRSAAAPASKAKPVSKATSSSKAASPHRAASSSVSKRRG
jgi:23S rRNA pseudouridine2605 synthase